MRALPPSFGAVLPMSAFGPRLFAIDIRSLPDGDCTAAGPSLVPVRDFLRHITQECDSSIDFLIGGKNILAGYAGALVYPTYMFLRNVNNGLADAIENGSSSIPIYVQQYSFDVDSPHHSLNLAIDELGSHVGVVTFSWCESIPRPEGLPVVDHEAVLVDDFMSQVCINIARFKDALAALAPLFGPQFSVALRGLFNCFSDLCPNPADTRNP
jgi:hypothetical protein